MNRNDYHIPFQLMRNQTKDGVTKQYYSFRWSEDGMSEWCEHEIVILAEDMECYGCLMVLPKGSEVVKLTSADGDIYFLEPACAYKH